MAVPKDGPNTAQLIAGLVPKDKPFTIPETMHWLHDATKKSYNEPTVRTYISRLCSRGAIRKLYKTGQNYALWVASESAVEEGPIETRSLHEVVAQILVEEGPRTVVEIVVGMRSRGYRQENTPTSLARAVRDMLKRYRVKFVRGKGGRAIECRAVGLIIALVIRKERPPLGVLKFSVLLACSAGWRRTKTPISLPSTSRLKPQKK